MAKRIGGGGLMNLVIGIAVSIIAIAFLIPVAINQFVAANTTGWEGGWVSMWNLIPVMVFFGLVIAVITFAYRRAH